MRLAHLTDLHLDGSKEPNERARAALGRAEQAGIQHLFLTGDLTADGQLKDFEELSALLHRWNPSAVTIVPGNHDLGDHGWTEVLARTGLGRFAETSVPGAIADRGALLSVALNTCFPKRALAFRAAGRVSEAQIERLDWLAERLIVLEATSNAPSRCVVVAMHHGPQRSPLQPFDGLQNRSVVLNSLAQIPSVHVLCGHDHRSLDLTESGVPIFCASSVREAVDPLRLYDVVGTSLQPVWRGSAGRYMQLF